MEGRKFLSYFVPGLVAGVLAVVAYDALVRKDAAKPAVETAAEPAPAHMESTPETPPLDLADLDTTDPKKRAELEKKGIYTPQKPVDDPCHCPYGKIYDEDAKDCVKGKLKCERDETVLGCDGKKYASKCHARKAGLKTTTAVARDAQSSCQCKTGQVYDGSTCVDPEQAKLVCKPSETFTLPVCGCDGQAYASVCEAQKAGIMQWRSGICAGGGTLGDPSTWDLMSECDDQHTPQMVLAMADGSYVLRRADGSLYRNATSCR